MKQAAEDAFLRRVGRRLDEARSRGYETLDIRDLEDRKAEFMAGWEAAVEYMRAATGR